MRTEQRYYETVIDYRTKLGDIWQNYEKEMSSIEQYRGSVGFEKKANSFERKRDSQIDSLQVEYRLKFESILSEMRKNTTAKGMTAPSQDDLAILQALQMREKIGVAELQQAGVTLKRNKLALSVLHEICEKSGYHGLQVGLSTSDILDVISGLSESASRLCVLRKPNSRGLQALRASQFSPEYDGSGISALKAFRVDKDFDSMPECISYLGGINTDNLEEFSEAVN